MTEQQQAMYEVQKAVRAGVLANLREVIVLCEDCGSRARAYDHRDYSEPLKVDAVCHRCNKLRGQANAWIPVMQELRVRVLRSLLKEFKLAALQQDLAFPTAVTLALGTWIDTAKRERKSNGKGAK